jgi:hypothetical protein
MKEQHIKSVINVVRLAVCCFVLVPIQLKSTMVFDKEKNKRIIELYFANHKSIKLTKRAYDTECRLEETPKTVTILAIRRIINKWDELGSAVHDRSRSGRPVTARSNANIRRIQRKLDSSPRRSAHRISRETGIKKEES